jgi:hypothetical protein
MVSWLDWEGLLLGEIYGGAKRCNGGQINLLLGEVEEWLLLTYPMHFS